MTPQEKEQALRIGAKVNKLSGLLSEYEQYLKRWHKIELRFVPKTNQGYTIINRPHVQVVYYKHRVLPSHDGSFLAYRDEDYREFLFTEAELDKAISRYEAKVKRERASAAKERDKEIDNVCEAIENMRDCYNVNEWCGPDLAEQVSTDLAQIQGYLTKLKKLPANRE